MAADQVLGLDLSRIVKAKPGAVFDAFTKSDQMKKWWGPEGMTCPKAEIDLRPGGRYETLMQAPDCTTRYVRGTFTEIEPGKKVAYTWAWYTDDKPGNETRVAVAFTEKDGGTEVHLHHEGFANQEECDQHNWGWSSSLDCLEKLF